MCYELHCKECGEAISAAQYDTHLGMCADCFANEEDLHDEPFDPGGGCSFSPVGRNPITEDDDTWPAKPTPCADELFDEGSPEAGQRRNIEREPFESWDEAKQRATRIGGSIDDHDPRNDY